MKAEDENTHPLLLLLHAISQIMLSVYICISLSMHYRFKIELFKTFLIV